METRRHQKTDEYAARLAEKQKLQKEKLDKKIFELENKLKAKEKLELEMANMERSVEVMLDTGECEGAEMREEIVELRKKFADKEQELEHLQELNGILTAKERKSNDELQEARKVLINGLEEPKTGALIGKRRMGDIDLRSFAAEMRRRYIRKEVGDEKAAEVGSYLQSLLSDSSWHPFKTVTNKDGTSQQVLDAFDEKLRNVSKYIPEVLDAFTTALIEINDYNPSGRTTVPELYHFGEKRRATLAEGIEQLLNDFKKSKRKKM